MVSRTSIIKNINITENQEIGKTHDFTQHIEEKGKDHISDVPNKYQEKPHHCVTANTPKHQLFVFNFHVGSTLVDGI